MTTIFGQRTIWLRFWILRKKATLNLFQRYMKKRGAGKEKWLTVSAPTAPILIQKAKAMSLTPNWEGPKHGFTALIFVFSNTILTAGEKIIIGLTILIWRLECTRQEHAWVFWKKW